MTRSLRRRAGGALAVAALVLGSAACSGGSPDGEEPERTTTEAAEDSEAGTDDDAAGDSDEGADSTDPGEDDADEGSADEESSEQDSSEKESPAASPDPTPQNEQDCGPIFDGWRAVIGSGEVDCATAVDVLTAFKDSDPRQDFDMPRQGAEVTGDWTCESIFHVRDGDDPLTYSMWCTRGEETVLTTAAGTPVLPGTYVPKDAYYFQQEGHDSSQVSFTSPSGTWGCGFLETFDDAGERNFEVGCHGTMPPEITAPAPDSEGDLRANSITLYHDRAPEVWVAGDVNYFAGPTLPYGHVIYTYGFACTVQQDTGVTCISPEHRFTASSSAVQTR